MKIYSNPQQNYILIILIILFGASLAYMSLMIFDGIMGAILFYVIGRSGHIYLTEKKGWNRRLSALIVITISFLVLILPFITLTWMVYEKVIFYEHNPNELGILKDKLWPMIKRYMADKKNLDDMISALQSKVLGIFSNALNSLSNIALQISIMYFLLYFMLKEYKKIEELLVRFLPFKKHHAHRLGMELVNITYSNLLGQGFICFVQGLLVTIGFWIFGLNDPIFWGVICFFLSFIPFVGAPLVFVPAGVIQLYSGDMVGGIGILIWGFVLVTNIDNVIRFYLSKKIGDLHPLISIVGVIIGIPTFGILGLVYGPLFISYFLLLVKIWMETNKIRYR